jgi:hypothetical protein
VAGGRSDPGGGATVLGRVRKLGSIDALGQLEDAQRIQSAEAVIAAVREAGRNPPIRDLWSQHDPEVRDAVKAIIARARNTNAPGQ